LSRITALISKMTLVEKVGQLTMTAGGHTVTGPTIAGDSIDAIKAGTVGNVLNLIGADHVKRLQRLAVEESRLGIPVLFALDVMHGYRTLFPVSLGEASLFDPQAWSLTAREMAREAAADGIALTFAPMLDVARDPRWGRIVEGPGEDPLVASRMAEAKVRGLQGLELSSPDSLAAVAKHFCAYGAVTAGREYASVDVSERTLREVYVPPFAAAVRAGVAAVMPAFTDLAGIPPTAHAPLLRGALRGQLGFRGVLVSDYDAIGELLRHGIAADLTEAAVLALKAGVDIDMMSGAYRHGLPLALERGLVGMDEIDEAVRRVLELKERLGLLDDPYARGTRGELEAGLAARRRLARSVAARAIVMLTNPREALPLGGSVRKIALLGPLAHAAAEMRGAWWAAAAADGHVTVLEGLRAALPAIAIAHAEGVPIEGEPPGGFGAALALTDDADAIVLCVGEATVMSGEAASRAHLDLPGEQRSFAEAVLERARARGTKVIAILFCGRPLTVSWLVEKADAVLVAWFLGSEAGNAVADVLTGRVSPSGRLPVSWPRALGQIPLFFAQRPGGRPYDPQNKYSSRYIDEPAEPLFAFGHGLGYGRFELSNLRASPQILAPTGTLEISVDVANTGRAAAEETVFLFVHDPLASVARPALELKGWGKIVLQPGERGTVKIHLPASELEFLGRDLEPVFEPGEVEILVGPCAARAELLSTRIQLDNGARGV
jgi:beta-glucosidase